MDAHPTSLDSYFWLLLVATLVAMLARRSKLPYAIALVLTGLAIGTPHLLPQAHLEPHTLFTVFLPPLLFEAAINLRVEALRKRWRTIALFALAGTVCKFQNYVGSPADLMNAS
jgi:CPA1 family monovalent cation:H+ antiporter